MSLNKKRGNDMSETISNRKYKDGVFIKLFHEKKKIIELYNALEGTQYDENTEVKMQTLEGVLYGRYRNDMAFEIDNKFVVLVEHQSTICNNMPLRMLLYLSRIYERIADIKTAYYMKQIKIPYPELYVLYNGRDDYPEESEMKLSESFVVKDNNINNLYNINLELKVKILNINHQKKSKILKDCPTLENYSYFIYMIRQYESKGMSRDEAIKTTIEDCIYKDILKEFLSKHGSEVHNMLFMEFNMEEELKAAEEVGVEKGIEKGKEEAINNVAKEMLRKGAEVDFVSGVTKLPKEKILELQKEVANEKKA